MQMSYETYAFLRNYIDKEIEKQESLYREVIGYTDKCNSISENIWEEFGKRQLFYKNAKEELRYAAGKSQEKQSKKMKKFWGI